MLENSGCIVKATNLAETWCPYTCKEKIIEEYFPTFHTSKICGYFTYLSIIIKMP